MVPIFEIKLQEEEDEEEYDIDDNW